MIEPSSPYPPFPLISLYIGARNGQAIILPFDRGTILSKTSAVFESFSIFEGRGCFRGKPEEIIRVDIATNRSRAVLELAADLRASLDQDGIGIASQGRYVRMTAEIAADHIKSRRDKSPLEKDPYSTLIYSLGLSRYPFPPEGTAITDPDYLLEP